MSVVVHIDQLKRSSIAGGIFSALPLKTALSHRLAMTIRSGSTEQASL
jgi:hypothetical protein